MLKSPICKAPGSCGVNIGINNKIIAAAVKMLHPPSLAHPSCSEVQPPNQPTKRLCNAPNAIVIAVSLFSPMTWSFGLWTASAFVVGPFIPLTYISYYFAAAATRSKGFLRRAEEVSGGKFRQFLKLANFKHNLYLIWFEPVRFGLDFFRGLFIHYSLFIYYAIRESEICILFLFHFWCIWVEVVKRKPETADRRWFGSWMVPITIFVDWCAFFVLSC